MLPQTGDAVVLGQIIGSAFACGVNLYAVIVLAGVGSSAGWFPGLPPDLRGIGHPLIIGSAAALYFIEFVADKIPLLDSAWDAVHTVIRPLAAALLVVLALGSQPVPFQVAAGMTAALVALAAHGTKAGLRLAVRAPSRGRIRVALSLLEDAVAISLVLAVLMVPASAVIIALATILVLTLAGPGLWRAGLLGFHAAWARIRAFFGTTGWLQAPQLPRWLRSHLARVGAPAGLETTRAARAALRGVKGVAPYHTGWLVVQPEGPAFFFWTVLGARRVALPFARSATVRPGILTDVIELDADPRRYALFLLKDGPPADVARAELLHH